MKYNQDMTLDDKKNTVTIANRNFEIEIECPSFDHPDPNKQDLLILAPKITMQVIADLKPREELIYIADVSGSMDGEPLNLVKKGIKTSVNALSKAFDLTVSLISFNHESNTVCFAESNLTEFSNKLDSLSAKGGTDIALGLNQLANLIEKLKQNGSKAQHITVFLMTDGQDSAKKNYQPILTELEKKIGPEWFSKLSIRVAGIGKEYDRKTLEEIAKFAETDVINIPNEKSITVALGAEDMESYINAAPSFEMKIRDQNGVIKSLKINSFDKMDQSFIEWPATATDIFLSYRTGTTEIQVPVKLKETHLSKSEISPRLMCDYILNAINVIHSAKGNHVEKFKQFLTLYNLLKTLTPDSNETQERFNTALSLLQVILNELVKSIQREVDQGKQHFSKSNNFNMDNVLKDAIVSSSRSYSSNIAKENFKLLTKNTENFAYNEQTKTIILSDKNGKSAQYRLIDRSVNFVRKSQDLLVLASNVEVTTDNILPNTLALQINDKMVTVFWLEDSKVMAKKITQLTDEELSLLFSLKSDCIIKQEKMQKDLQNLVDKIASVCCRPKIMLDASLQGFEIRLDHPELQTLIQDTKNKSEQSFKLNDILKFVANIFEDTPVNKRKANTIFLVELNDRIKDKQGFATEHALLTAILIGELVTVNKLPPGTVRILQANASNLKPHSAVIYKTADEKHLYIIDTMIGHVFDLRDPQEITRAIETYKKYDRPDFLRDFLENYQYAYPVMTAEQLKPWLAQISTDEQIKLFQNENCVCPLSPDEVMEDPVEATDGCVYDRRNINEWINHNKAEKKIVLSPITGKALGDELLPATKTVRKMWTLIQQLFNKPEEGIDIVEQTSNKTNESDQKSIKTEQSSKELTNSARSINRTHIIKRAERMLTQPSIIELILKKNISSIGHSEKHISVTEEKSLNKKEDVSQEVSIKPTIEYIEELIPEKTEETIKTKEIIDENIIDLSNGEFSQSRLVNRLKKTKGHSISLDVGNHGRGSDQHELNIPEVEQILGELIKQKVSVRRLNLEGAVIIDAIDQPPISESKYGVNHRNIIGDFFATHTEIQDLEWLFLQHVYMTKKAKSGGARSRSAIKHLLDNIKKSGKLKTLVLSNVMCYTGIKELIDIANFIRDNQYLEELHVGGNYLSNELTQKEHDHPLMMSALLNSKLKVLTGYDFGSRFSSMNETLRSYIEKEDADKTSKEEFLKRLFFSDFHGYYPDKLLFQRLEDLPPNHFKVIKELSIELEDILARVGQQVSTLYVPNNFAAITVEEAKQFAKFINQQTKLQQIVLGNHCIPKDEKAQIIIQEVLTEFVKHRKDKNCLVCYEVSATDEAIVEKKAVDLQVLSTKKEIKALKETEEKSKTNLFLTSEQQTSNVGTSQNKFSAFNTVLQKEKGTTKEEMLDNTNDTQNNDNLCSII